MISLERQPVEAGPGLNQPSLAAAALGFIGSTLLTATIMVLLSAI
jgi:hypothetical protein